MRRKVTTAPILTYHSISNEPGPTSIPPEIFLAQMEAIGELGVNVVGLDEIEDWISGGREFSRRTVAITFDDAFLDFKETAFPILESRGFSSTVFVPTSLVGSSENWIGANNSARQLMSWDDIGELSKKGVSFGSHSERHVDLTLLEDVALEEDLSKSRRDLETRLDKPAPHFAPPYGRSDNKVLQAIARHYSLSVGVSLDEARQDSPIHDLPRIEMYYYSDISRWRAFLSGKGCVYLQLRRAARGLRGALPAPNHRKRNLE